MQADLNENYRSAYGNRIGFGKRPALILIDFVQAYFDQNSPLFADVDAELRCALSLRDRARESKIPVIYTKVVYVPGGWNGGRFFQKVKPLASFVEGNPMGNWPDGLEPALGELVLTKQYPSSFFGTSLASTLTAAQIDTLIITGLTTSGCVRATCIDACSHGFIPIIVEDACGDRHEAPHKANLFDMNAKYGDVVTAAETASYLASLGS